MRRKTADQILKQAASETAQPPLQPPNAKRFFMAALLLAIPLSSETAMAEADGALVSGPPPAAIDFVSDAAIDDVVFAALVVDEPVAPPLATPVVEAVSAPLSATQESFVVRVTQIKSRFPLTVDEALAMVVARGSIRDLEPRNPFRKRNRDLFRTERPLSIGQAEMVMRLRLRAVTRNAMSVELRF